MKYIGADVHISSIDFCVVDDKGRVVKRAKIPTSAKEFIKFIQSVPKARKIFIEEGCLASWLLEVANDQGEELIICDAKQNHWICRAGQKNDKVDAEKLAQLARGGYIKEVHHPIGYRRRYKELVFHYHDSVKSAIRIKNKIKSRFRSNGISCTGCTVYNKKYRKEWLVKLPKDKLLHYTIIDLWAQLDLIEAVIRNAKNQIIEESKRLPEIKSLKQIPGIGPIIAATFVAIIETPHRFSNKKKLWMYAGIGIEKHASGKKVYYSRLNRNFNRLLKKCIKHAAEAAIKGKKNQFNQHYLKLKFAGAANHVAKLIVARSILSTVYSIWKKGESYRKKIIKLPHTYLEAV